MADQSLSGDAVVDDEMLAIDDLDASGQASLGRRLAAEFVGALIFIGVGTGAATVLAAGPFQRLNSLANVPNFNTPANLRVFGALLGTAGSNFGDFLPVALAFALALALMVYAVGGVSGAHFNPAVTFALAVTRRFDWRDVVPYWVAQILGGIAGAFIVAGIYGQNGASVSVGTAKFDVLFGATQYHHTTTTFWQALLAEALVAFILMTAIMAVAVDRRSAKGWSGLVIGLALGAGILVTGQATGGSANFARSLGPFVASIPYKVGSIPWHDLYVYAAGPIIGAVAAALIYESVTGLERVAPAPQPGAATGEEGDEELLGEAIIVEEVVEVEPPPGGGEGTTP